MKYFSCKSETATATCNSKTTKKKKKKQTKKGNSTQYTYSAEYRLFSYEELESATNSFSPNYLLGKGSHGNVYKAIIDNRKLVVAVKKKTVLSSSSAEENNNYSSSSSSFCCYNNNNNNNNSPIENEIEILSRIRNPGFVNLLGYSLDPNDRKLIVVEFMANGSLYEHLHCNRSLPRWGRRILFAAQTAKAVEALHLSDPPVIHRDIKSSNVLIDENWNARLGDFGLALRGHEEDVRIRSTPPAGTMGYLDPGYVTPENLSTKSDVFSFGILLLEIVSGRNAIDVNYTPPSIVDWAVPLIKQGKWDLLYDPRIGLPKDVFVRRQLAVLAARCIQTCVEKRPSMSEVVNCLRIMRRRTYLSVWNNLANRMKNSKLELESSKEIPMATKCKGRNSARNRKVSNLQFGVHMPKEPATTMVCFGGCKNSIEIATQPKAASNSKMGNSNAGLVVKMPGIRLNKSRSIEISKTNRILRVSAGKEDEL